MNRNTLYCGLSLLFALSACTPRAVPGSSGRTGTTAAVTYNGYNDDLAAARPSYSVVAAPSTVTPAPSVVKPDVATVPARKSTPPETVRRTEGPAEVLHVNKRLDAVLDTIALKNRSVRYASGYRIQIYVGNEREEADAAKLQVYQSFPELSPYMSYKQPTYRLKVGDFMRRLDAEWYLSQLKQQFTSVILQPDKVDIRRSLLIK